jgi:hypothetical protein
MSARAFVNAMSTNAAGQSSTSHNRRLVAAHRIPRKSGASYYRATQAVTGHREPAVLSRAAAPAPGTTAERCEMKHGLRVCPAPDRRPLTAAPGNAPRPLARTSARTPDPGPGWSNLHIFMQTCGVQRGTVRLARTRGACPSPYPGTRSRPATLPLPTGRGPLLSWQKAVWRACREKDRDRQALRGTCARYPI